MSQEGSVLLITLWVLMLSALLVLESERVCYVQHRLVTNYISFYESY